MNDYVKNPTKSEKRAREEGEPKKESVKKQQRERE